jgi:hypothetical protein
MKDPVRKYCDIWFDAFSSTLFNAETHSFLPCLYQKLLKKCPRLFISEMDSSIFDTVWNNIEKNTSSSSYEGSIHYPISIVGTWKRG